MIKKLSERTHGEVDVAEMEKMLEEGELRQISIELDGTVDTKVSIDFMQYHLAK
jgi:hypothetical protein